MIRRDKLFIAPPPLFYIYYISTGSLKASRVVDGVQRRSFVSLRAFGANEANVTRQINYARGEWPTRAACLPITPLATSQGLQIRSSPFTWERWSQIAALGPSLLSDVSALCSDAKKKKQPSQRVREVARATSALLEAVVQKVAIHNCVSGSLAPVLQCSWRGRQLLKCLSGMRGSVLARTRKFSSCFVLA